MPDTPSPTSRDPFLIAINSEIEQARQRQSNLMQDAKDATLKAEVVGEYRWKMEKLRDKFLSESLPPGAERMSEAQRSSPSAPGGDSFL